MTNQKTILEIAQSAGKRLSLGTITTFVGSSNNNLILLLSMIIKTMDEVRNEYEWPQLTKEHPFYLHQDQASYPLPPDYDRRLDETLWNQSQHWPLIGPVTPIIWQQYKSGFITTLPRQRFRVKGAGINQFYIDPTPSSDDDDQVCVYEYLSTTMIKAALWTSNTAISLNAYRSWNGNTYKCTTAGTTSAATYAVGPTVVNGKGLDNTVQWAYVSAWVMTTFYNVGDYVNANNNIYKCTQAGASGGTAPSVTSGSETDNTVVWEFQYTPSSWNGGFNYTKNEDYVTANTKFYRCTATGISGTISPNWTFLTQTDSSVVWTYQETYDSFTADTDIVLLDSQMVIDGAVWRFLQDRGFDYQDIKMSAEEQKEVIKSKLDGASTVSVNPQNNLPWAIGLWSYPPGNFGQDR